jgi:hypothetical protein
MSIGDRYHKWRYRVWKARYYRACMRLKRENQKHLSNGYWRFENLREILVQRVYRCEERMQYHRFIMADDTGRRRGQ